MVEGGGEDFISVGVVAETDDFGMMALQRVYFGALFHVPDFGGVVHGAGGDQLSLRVESHTDDLHAVAIEGLQKLAAVGFPELGGAIEGAGDDLVAAGLDPTYPKGTLKARVYTTFLWSAKVCSSAPVTVSQTLQVRS